MCYHEFRLQCLSDRPEILHSINPDNTFQEVICALKETSGNGIVSCSAMPDSLQPHGL